ncbi:MAG: hypothetical protein AABN95_10765 [Acidobacteriota bacterium]
MATAKAGIQTVAIEDDAESRKQELEQQMEESRESISQTVTDIKDAVAGEYQSIKQGISDTFDWREHFRKHPVAWMLGALSVGYVVGSSLSDAYRGAKGDNELLSYLGALGDKFTSELSKQGMSILAPALTGTVLVPILTGQLKEAFGIDLSDFSRQLLADPGNGKGKKGKSKAGKKARKKTKSGSKSNRAKKSST